MESTLEVVINLLEAVFAPLLAIELVWLWRRSNLSAARVKEMLANVSSLLFIIPAGGLGIFVWYRLFDAISAALPYSVPTNWFTVVLVILLADLTYYLEHRFEHEHRLPWDLYHSVHHSSASYDQTTGLRLGLFDALLSTVYLLPLVVLGFSPTIVLIASGLVVGYQTWIHTEVITKLPRGSSSSSTPRHITGPITALTITISM